MLQRVVCQCAAGGVLCSGVVLRYRERSVSVQLVVYCVPVLYYGTESGLSVCSWWCIVYRCCILVQRAVYPFITLDCQFNRAVCSV